MKREIGEIILSLVLICGVAPASFIFANSITACTPQQMAEVKAIDSVVFDVVQAGCIIDHAFDPDSVLRDACKVADAAIPAARQVALKHRMASRREAAARAIAWHCPQLIEDGGTDADVAPDSR